MPYENSLGIVTAADIGILFNATEPSGNSITVDDVTLKFYLNGNLIGAIDGGPQLFANSFAGNGVAGFVFRVALDQQAYVNGLLALGNIQFALEATLSDSAGGPETFRVVNLNAPPPDIRVPVRVPQHFTRRRPRPNDQIVVACGQVFNLPRSDP